MKRISKDPEERKNEILDAAEELFNQNGFDNTPVSEIVNKVGVAQGTFYYYFNTKDDIIIALLERSFNHVENKVNEIFVNNTLTPLQKLEFILKMIIAPQGNDNDMESYFKMDENEKIHQKRDFLFFEKFEPIIEIIVKEGIKKGVFDVFEYKEISKILFLGIDKYIHIYYHTFNDKKEFSTKVKAIAELLEKVLGIKKGSLKLTE